MFGMSSVKCSYFEKGKICW